MTTPRKGQTHAPEPIAPGIVRLRAPNPSPMTEAGTNTYLLGAREIAVIDPGPEDPAHLDAILRALPRGARITHVIVTHSHLDHSPLARPLAEATGAPVLGFGPSTAGRSAVMEALAAAGHEMGGGEGVDAAFAPDHVLADGEVIGGDGWRLEVVHTPGHFGNHICLGEPRLGVLFTGDHVMGWAPSLVSPPDGDMGDFMRSLDRLRRRRTDTLYLPGHGAPVTRPHERVEELRRHRLAREAAIRAALAEGPGTPAALAARIYTDVPAALLPAAARNVFAHLVELARKNEAKADGPLSPAATFHLAGPRG